MFANLCCRDDRDETGHGAPQKKLISAATSLKIVCENLNPVTIMIKQL